MSPAQERIDNLRRAIRNNRISFPAQMPIFEQSRADIQWRLVLLYFIRGWTCKQLSARYDLTRQRIEQLIAEWVDSAVTHGYLQEIPPSGEMVPACRQCCEPYLTELGQTVSPAQSQKI
jgi:hypothetical protein